MNIPKDKILALGRGYFTEDLVNSFIQSLETLCPNPDMLFFQVTQRNNIPTLEVGCKRGDILVDITASPEKVTTIVDLFSAVSSVMLTEVQTSTTLTVYLHQSVGLIYLAVSDENRKELREYAAYLRSCLGRK